MLAQEFEQSTFAQPHEIITRCRISEGRCVSSDAIENPWGESLGGTLDNKRNTCIPYNNNDDQNGKCVDPEVQ